MTYPIVGSYGVPSRTAVDAHGLPTYFESSKIQIEGLIVQDYAAAYSHWNASSSLSEWLREGGVPGVSGVDTRLLTAKIRDSGAILGKIIYDGGSPIAKGPYVDPNSRNLVAEVSGGVRTFGKGGKFRVLAVDCGIKNNMIVRSLAGVLRAGARPAGTRSSLYPPPHAPHPHTPSFSSATAAHAR